MEARYVCFDYVYFKNKYGLPIRMEFETMKEVQVDAYFDFMPLCEACETYGKDSCSKNKFGLCECKFKEMFIKEDLTNNYVQEILEEVNKLKKCECGMIYFYEKQDKCFGCLLQEQIDNDKELGECSICLEKMGDLDSLETECCNQRIHINCYKDSCPFCRKEN